MRGISGEARAVDGILTLHKAEHDTRAAAPTFAAWLGTRCERLEFPVATHTKMETWWNRGPAGLP